ncbi:MAG: hypothetical protein IJ357_07700 [Oscillospiraceae bacterium]|nr:hypothetical protein [Oscillospiraceae bacterium]
MKLRIYRKLLPALFLSFLFVWFLTERAGFVAVVDGDGAPVWVSETPLDLLPPADAAAIRAGIRCEDRAELSRALENFCS